MENMYHHFQTARDQGVTTIKLLAYLGIDYAQDQQRIKKAVEDFKKTPNGEILKAMETIKELERKLRNCINNKTDEYSEDNGSSESNKLTRKPEHDRFKDFMKR